MLAIFLFEAILSLILILMLPEILLNFSDVFQSLRHVVHIKDMKLMYLGENVYLF